MFLLVPAHPGCPGQIPQSRKTVVCVCVFPEKNLTTSGLDTLFQKLQDTGSINRRAGSG